MSLLARLLRLFGESVGGEGSLVRLRRGDAWTWVAVLLLLENRFSERSR